MSMEFNINVYNSPDNNSRDEMIQFISEHNDKFAEYTLIESARMWNLIPNVEEKSSEQILEGYYERLFGTVITAEHGDKVIGIVSFKESFGEEGGWLDGRVKNNYWPLHWLSFILIDEEHRRKGVWTDIYNYVRTDVIPNCEKTYERLGFATSSRKESMKQFASKNNFECVNVIPDDRGDGINSCIFIKDLNPNKLSE